MPLSWYETLFEDQKPAADFVLSQFEAGLGAGLICEQGTGKTIITLAVMEHLSPARTLIVTPLTSVHVTWGKRIPDATTDWEQFSTGTLIIGYECFRNNIKRLMKLKWQLVVFDEAQNLKDRASKQSRAARRLRELVPYRLILTGTPIDESPIDLWAQMRFIEPKVLGDVWSAPLKRHKRVKGAHYFETEFLRPCGFKGYSREFIPELMPQFLERITPYLFRLESVLIKPRIIPIDVYLGREQQRLHDKMQTAGIIRFEDGKVKAGLRVTQDLRCFQIVGGSVSDDQGNVYRTGDAKQKALKRLLPRLVRPVVFCRFLSEVEDVRKILAKEFDHVAVLNGSIKDKPNDRQRTNLLNDFQAGKIDALVCQSRTGGVSVEFTRTNELVMYSMAYSYIDFEQIVARFRRYGQDKQVRVYLLIARNTIDEEPYDRITKKSNVVQPIMKHIKEHSMSDEAKKEKKAKPAVAKSKPVAEKKAPKEKAAPAEAFKYGIHDLAEKLGVADASARVQCRNKGIDKAGKSYGWNSKTELEEVVSKLKKAA
jgi:SNF2 family DNA or RNA helicase